MATGGDVIEITYNHDTLGSGTLYVKAGEDSEFDPGGLRSEDDGSGVDGGGNMIDKMNRVRWKSVTTVSWDMNGENEIAKIALLASSPVQADWTIAHVNGTVWSGKGKPVGDYSGNGNAATFPLTLGGGGELKKTIG